MRISTPHIPASIEAMKAQSEGRSIFLQGVGIFYILVCIISYDYSPSLHIPASIEAMKAQSEGKSIFM